MGPKRRRTKSPYFDNIESEVADSQSNVPSELPTTTRRTRGRSKTVRTTKQDVQDIISSSVLVEDEVLKTHEDDSNELTTSKRKTRSRVPKSKKQNAVESTSDVTFPNKQNEVKLDFEDIADEPSTSKGKKRKKEVTSKKNIGNGQKPESVSCDIGNYHKDSLNEPSTSKGVSRSRRSVNRNLSKNSSTVVNGNKNESDDSQDLNHSDEKINNGNSDSDDDSDADDWEEVEEAQIADDEDALENYKPQLPEQGVQITIDGPKIFNKKRRKKQVDVDELLRQQINRMKKELQVEMHKTHLLCLLSRGFYLNRLTYHPLISSLALSHLTSFNFDLKKVNLLFVRDFTNWFRSWFTLEKKPRSKTDLLDSLTQAFETNAVYSQVAYVLMFLAFLRIYSPKIQLRLCYALNPISIKPDNLIMTDKQRSKTKSSKDESEEPTKSKSSSKTAGNKLPSGKLNAEKNDSKTKKTTNINLSRGKKRKKSSDEEDEDYEMDSDDEKRSKGKGKGKGKGKEKGKPKAKVLKVENKAIISEDDSNDLVVVKTTEDKNLLEYWCEIYVETEEKWICLDVETGIWDDPSKIEKRSHNPLLYVVSWDNFSHVKDVSQRYCSDFASCKFRRARIDEDWWNETLSFFRPHKRTRQEKREDKQLAEIFADRPMPTTLSDFKNHPLYVLKKHLLKYEVIYPPDSPTLGNFRGEPVYARECVKDVHSKEYWMRQARVVRSDEEPYKMSIKRKKWDRNLGDFLRDLPLELYGEWQTDPYIPPTAKDGKVPRNQYGNVELFQPCMLPKGTVYLQLPGLIRIANKLKIDCAPAVVGFDNCSGGAGVHPVFEGFVVCEEFADTLKAAWEEEQMNIRKRELEKREKRIYGNWKRLIIGVLIKEQVKLKYNREQSEDTETGKSCGITLDDIDTILSMYAKKRKKGPNKAKKPKSSVPSKKSNKRKSKKGEDTSDEEDEDEDDDIDDFIVDDDEDLEENEENIRNNEDEEAETELEISDSE